jgi:hypothetical protein
VQGGPGVRPWIVVQRSIDADFELFGEPEPERWSQGGLSRSVPEHKFLGELHAKSASGQSYRTRDIITGHHLRAICLKLYRVRRLWAQSWGRKVRSFWRFFGRGVKPGLEGRGGCLLCCFF